MSLVRTSSKVRLQSILLTDRHGFSLFAKRFHFAILSAILLHVSACSFCCTGHTVTVYTDVTTCRLKICLLLNDIGPIVTASIWFGGLGAAHATLLLTSRLTYEELNRLRCCGLQWCKAPFTRYNLLSNRLSNRFDDRFDNWLYRV